MKKGITLHFEPCMPPNFIKIKGMGAGVFHPIGMLTKPEIEEYAEVCKQNIINHWAKKKITQNVKE